MMKVKCPICAKPVAWVPESKYRPFCSERCRLIDLGEWASGNRAIPEGTGEPWKEGEEQEHRDDH